MSARSELRVWISRQSIELIQQLYHDFLPNEVGGLLLGYWSNETCEAVVTSVTKPGPNARHFRAGYLPDHEHDQIVIDVEYERSGRVITYLGDWHTHPFSPPSLSSIDKRTLKGIARFPDARASQPLMLIYGVESDSETVNFYTVYRNHRQLFKFWKYLELEVQIYEGT